MSRFKSGDPALVVASRFIPENIGCVVELVQRLEPGDLYGVPDSGELRTSAGGEGWLAVGRIKGMARDQDGSIFYEYGHALFREADLLPLKGEPTSEQQKAREVAG